MTEASQIYHVARRYLSHYGRWERIENGCSVGFPDVYYLLRGVSGFVECKIFDTESRPRHLTIEQVRWGEAETRWGGRWHLLARFSCFWLLYNVASAQALLGGEPSTPLLKIQGRFPTRELLAHLAPTSSAVRPPRSYGFGVAAS